MEISIHNIGRALICPASSALPAVFTLPLSTELTVSPERYGEYLRAEKLSLWFDPFTGAVSSERMDGISAVLDLLICRKDATYLLVQHSRHSDDAALRTAALIAGLHKNAQRIEAIAYDAQEATELLRITLDRAEMEQWREKLSAALEVVIEHRKRVESGQVVDVTIGEHCKGCPAFRACPANLMLVREMAAANSDIAKEIGQLSPEDAGRVWASLKQVKRLIEEIEDALKLYADQQPIPLPDGVKELVRTESRVELIRGKDAISVLQEQLGDAVFDIVDVSVKKKQLQRVLKERLADNAAVKETMQRLLRTLREAGAVEERRSVIYREKKRVADKNILETEEYEID